jgi:hypothetical protein
MTEPPLNEAERCLLVIMEKLMCEEMAEFSRGAIAAAAKSGSFPGRSAPEQGQWLAEAVATFGTAVDDLRRSCPRTVCRSICRRPLYDRSLLVHSVDFLCQSRGTIAQSLSDACRNAPHAVSFVAAELAAFAILLARWLWTRTA